MSSLVGKQAPPIALPDPNGETFNLVPGETGFPIALFFYPKSGSYGCTMEVCQFRDAVAEKASWKSAKVQVVGVSADAVDKQKAFVEKNKVTYPILSDENGEARKAYGVGKGLLGIADARVTFIIDGKGIVRDSLDSGLNIFAHAKFVTTWLEKLKQEGGDAAASSDASNGLL